MLLDLPDKSKQALLPGTLYSAKGLLYVCACVCVCVCVCVLHDKIF